MKVTCLELRCGTSVPGNQINVLRAAFFEKARVWSCVYFGKHVFGAALWAKSTCLGLHFGENTAKK